MVGSGGASTARVSAAVVLPAAFVPVTVYTAAAAAAAGVPEMTPVDAASASPDGRAGLTE